MLGPVGSSLRVPLDPEVGRDNDYYDDDGDRGPRSTVLGG